MFFFINFYSLQNEKNKGTKKRRFGAKIIFILKARLSTPTAVSSENNHRTLQRKKWRKTLNNFHPNRNDDPSQWQDVLDKEQDSEDEGLCP